MTNGIIINIELPDWPPSVLCLRDTGEWWVEQSNIGKNLNPQIVRLALSDAMIILDKAFQSIVKCRLGFGTTAYMNHLKVEPEGESDD